MSDWDPIDCSPPGSSVHGIFQARILEQVAISFSRGSSWPRNQTHSVLHLLSWKAGSLPAEPPGKPLMVCAFSLISPRMMVGTHYYKSAPSSLPKCALSKITRQWTVLDYLHWIGNWDPVFSSIFPPTAFLILTGERKVLWWRFQGGGRVICILTTVLEVKWSERSSVVSNSLRPRTIQSTEFSRPEYWNE